MLVLALWSLAILTAFAVSLGYMVRQKVTLLDRLEKRQLLWNAAWSAVERARVAVKEDVDVETDSFRDGWASDPRAFRDVKFEGAAVSVRYEWEAQKKTPVWGLSDEQGKLNLNTADVPAISLLTQQVTDLEAEEADALAYAIVDWRDGDSAYGHPDMGAEDADYGGLPDPYGAKDRPMESLDELLLVKGMNRDIFEKMKPFVTVFGSGVVNLNTARREVLVALGLPLSAADKILLHRDGPDGLPATSDDRPFDRADSVSQNLQTDEPPPSDIERVAIDNLTGSGKAGVQSGVFGVTSRAVSPDGRAQLVLEAVINRDAEVLYCRSSGLRWQSA